MTKSKKQESVEKAKKPAAQTGSELSEADLHQASGGALNAYKSGITDGTHSAGGGGGAGIVGHIWVDKTKAAGDGSV
ncbi:hypothetical protein [Dongia sp. agr-C8]